MSLAIDIVIICLSVIFILIGVKMWTSHGGRVREDLKDKIDDYMDPDKEFRSIFRIKSSPSYKFKNPPGKFLNKPKSKWSPYVLNKYGWLIPKEEK